jgi:uncharacterized repeat protein (TIGR03803 family)
MKNFSWYALVQVSILLLAFCSTLAASSEQIIFTFPADGSGGSVPTGGLISDATGNLYGTTESGGASGHGAVFKLSFENGTWTEDLLYSFKGGPDDGSGPESALLLDTAGNLYGTTAAGGPSNNGTVFKLAQMVLEDGRRPCSTLSMALTEASRSWLRWLPTLAATYTELPRDTVTEGHAAGARSMS